MTSSDERRELRPTREDAQPPFVTVQRAVHGAFGAWSRARFASMLHMSVQSTTI